MYVNDIKIPPRAYLNYTAYYEHVLSLYKEAFFIALIADRHRGSYKDSHLYTHNIISPSLLKIKNFAQKNDIYTDISALVLLNGCLKLQVQAATQGFLSKKAS